MLRLLHVVNCGILNQLSSTSIVFSRNLSTIKVLNKKVVPLLQDIRYISKARSYFEDLMKTMSSTVSKNVAGEDQAVAADKDCKTQKSANKEKVNAEQSESSPDKKKRNRHKNRKGNKANEHNEQTESNNRKPNNNNRQHGHHNANTPKRNSDIPECLLSAQPNNKKQGQSRQQQQHEYEEDGEEAHEGHKEQRRQAMRAKLPTINFQPYITFEECSEGLKRGELLQGSLRINVRNFHEAYITSSLGGRDIYIDGVSARNRALPGDIVAIKLLPREEWKRNNRQVEMTDDAEKLESKENMDEKDLIKTAKVVFIIEKKHPRIASGHLNPYRSNSFGFALMSPIDNRLPRLMIPLTDCPEDFKARPKDFEKTLFIARISSWNLNMAFASGKLMRSLGEAGHIEPETESLLISNNIDTSPFDHDVIDCLPNGDSWSISSEELAKRKDLREECIFTIDPATARDLDDALSCKKLDEDLFEVGVHIADVSHFIEQGNALDTVAMSRATSVYIAQRVIPMLPSVLCEKLCSLNPGVERLAYSVIWNLRSDGTILKEWFGRTVIRSCAKLSYSHAQQLIEATQSEPLKAEQYPDIHGKYPLEIIRDTVKNLFGISRHLRTKRFESGALRLDQPKLAFSLDKESGLPNGFNVYEYKDSNRMIEEFMLYANMAVGRKIYRDQPDRAILRCHPPPHPTMMEDVLNVCKQHNIPFDISDSASISRSLDNLSELDPEIQKSLAPALVLLCTKPFQNAKYFCTGSVDNEAAYRHYALNVPIYTHFTSPIRRYPDVLVHRFLTSSLNGDFEVNGEVKELQAIAEHCNDKKWAAKKASEQSSLLFFAVYLMECGPISEKGVVVGVLDKAVDVLCIRLGTVNRVYCDKLSLYKHEYKVTDLKQELILHWEDESKKTVEEKIIALTQKFEKNWANQKKKASTPTPDKNEPIPDGVVTQSLAMFSPVDVILSVERNTPTKITAVLKSPFVNDTPQLNL